MFPIIELEDLIRPPLTSRPPRVIYLLYEGQNTEPMLINPLISNTSMFQNTPVIFRPLQKSGNSVGITDPFSLVKKANEFIEDKIKDYHTKKPFQDRIMVVFDLDVLENDQEKMNQLLAVKRKEVILCYTNPAIELFILLAKEESYKNIIMPHAKELIKNQKSSKNSRLIANLCDQTFLINTKKSNVNFSFVLKNIDIVFKQESEHLNRKLSGAANTLTSNIGYVLTMIKEDRADEIEY
jgi:hypothetical protein